jgi:tetratricopeptide (TPR) repeat protein
MAQARAGKSAEAVETARSVRDKGSRAYTLAVVGEEMANGGRIRQVLELVRSVDDDRERDLVLDSVLHSNLEPSWTFEGWRGMGRYSAIMRMRDEQPPAKVDGADEAVRIAMILPEEQRSLGLGIVAVAQARAGEIQAAVDLLPRITQQKSRFRALLEIGRAQAKAGLRAQSIASFDQALQAARSFVPRDRYLSALAKAQAAAGQIGEALNVTRFIEDTEATAGGRSWTETDGKRLSDDFARRQALYEIARAQAKAGLVADALESARSTEQLGWRILQGLGVVAEGLAEVGRIDEALSAAEAVENRYRRAGLLADIARSQAAAGKHAEALRVARAVSEPDDRVQALVAAAAAQAKAGLTREASATFHEALQIVQSLSYKGQVVSALVAIGRALPD